jgi:hypothetical protein
MAEPTRRAAPVMSAVFPDSRVSGCTVGESPLGGAGVGWSIGMARDDGLVYLANPPTPLGR